MVEDCDSASREEAAAGNTGGGVDMLECEDGMWGGDLKQKKKEKKREDGVGILKGQPRSDDTKTE